MENTWWIGNGYDTTATGAMSRITQATSTLVHVERFWTWREAIEVASRANCEGRVTVKRDGNRWAVSYRVRLILMNAG